MAFFQKNTWQFSHFQHSSYVFDVKTYIEFLLPEQHSRGAVSNRRRPCLPVVIFLCVYLGQCRFQIGQDIVDILNAHREADQIRGHPGRIQLLIVHLPVGGGGGMQYAGLGIGHMGDDGGQIQPCHKGLGRP